MGISGYRLNAVTLRQANTRASLDLAKLDGVTAAEVFASQALAIRGKTFVGHAIYKEEPDSEATAPGTRERLTSGTPILRVDDVKRTGERVEVLVSYGRAGDYDFLIRANGGEDHTITAEAAGRKYPVIFFGSKVGTQCVIASGVAGRTYVGTSLLTRLSVEAWRAAQNTADKGAWRKWFHDILVDEDHVRDVVEKGKVDGIRVKRKGYDKAGQQSSQPLMLTQQGIRPADRNKVAELVLGWVKAAAGKKSTGNVQTAVAALVGFLDTSSVDVSGIGFDDGALSFHEGGKTQSIAPSNLHKILTYPLKGDATIDDIRAGASGRIAAMKASLDGNFDQT